VQAAEFPLYLGRIADAIAARGAAAAANAMAAEFHAELTRVTLRKSSHAAGTPTPARPGDPPAMVSGALARSAEVVPALASGTRAVSACRVTAVYARIQAKGGTVTVKRARVLMNRSTGQVFGRSVKLPPRPYMEPTRDLLLATGRLRARGNSALAAVIRGAAG
jgi:hypothetical protein